jgi:hypothetical protein
MAYSADEGKQFFKEWVFNFICHGNIRKVLDVGAGAGAYGKLIRQAEEDAKKWVPDLEMSLTAVEAFAPYVEKFHLDSMYDIIFADDIVNFRPAMNYDLTIMGDVLEHIEKDAAIAQFKYLKTISRFLWLSLPVKFDREWSHGYNQLSGEWAENPKEQHQHDWLHSEVMNELGPFIGMAIYPTVGVYIAEGNVK